MSSDSPALRWSYYDNPVYKYTDTLRNDYASDGRWISESVTATVDGWRFGSFDLTVSTSGGDAARGSVDLTLAGTPDSYALTMQMDSEGDSGKTFPFHANGLRVGYSKQAIGAYHQANDGNQSATLTQTSIALFPGTLLVPLQIVRLVAKNPESQFAPSMAAYTQASFQKFVDFAEPVATTRVTHPWPDYYPSVTRTSPSVRKLPFLEPDPIFAQCGVQFRLVDCAGAAPGAGCPDVPVEDGLLFPLDSCGDQNHTYAVIDAAKSAKGLNPHIPTIALTYQVNQNGCNVIDSASDRLSTAVVGINSQYQGGGGSVANVIAHELGHVMGLSVHCDARDGCPANVMDTYVGNGTNLTSGQCQQVRARAATYVKSYWGQAIDPVTGWAAVEKARGAFAGKIQPLAPMTFGVSRSFILANVSKIKAAALFAAVDVSPVPSLEGRQALELSGVVPGSVASALGFLERDVLRKMNGVDLGSKDALFGLLSSFDFAHASSLVFEIERGGAVRRLQFKIN
jgi:hypothetical protein